MKGFDYKQHADKLLFVLALVVLALVLFPKGGGFAVPQAAKIVFTQWWEDDLEENTLQELVAEFEALYGGIEIVISKKSYEDLRRDLFDPSVAALFGDVLALDPLWVPELQKGEIIECSNPSLLSFINVLFYNIDILKDSGFSRPPKSRSEFINYTRAIKEKSGSHWGLVLDKDSSRWVYDDVYPWIWSSGAQLITDEHSVVNSRPVIEGLSFLAALQKEDLFVSGNKLEDFCSGKAAFMLSPAKNIKFVRERIGDQTFGVSSVPSQDNYAGQSYYGTTEWTIGISAASAHKEEAKLFADFLAEKSSVLSEKSGALGVLPNMDPFYSKVWDIAITGEPAREFSGHPWALSEKAFQEELNRLFSGELTPAETAAEIQERWEALF